MSEGYTKLFSSIITSTIWQEDDKTRILWITMLALSDSEGKVEGSVPGLARMAKISVKECEKSLAKLASPDTYSRSKEHEGRRIKDVDGGWMLLNRVKYRDKTGDRKEYYQKYNAERAHRCAQVRTTNNTINTQKEKEKEKENKVVLPIPIPKNINITNNTNNKIVKNSLNEKLALDLAITDARNLFTREIQKIFSLSKGEAYTFAKLTIHLVNLCRSQDRDIGIFKDAIEWARQAKASSARNQKGLFVSKIKRETGFKKQERLLS